MCEEVDLRIRRPTARDPGGRRPEGETVSVTWNRSVKVIALEESVEKSHIALLETFRMSPNVYGAFTYLSAGTVAKKVFEVRAYWSTEGNDWCAINDELPVAAEAPTLDALLAEVKAQAAEMAELNGLAAPGEEIEVRLVETVEVRAAP